MQRPGRNVRRRPAAGRRRRNSCHCLLTAARFFPAPADVPGAWQPHRCLPRPLRTPRGPEAVLHTTLAPAPTARRGRRPPAPRRGARRCRRARLLAVMAAAGALRGLAAWPWVSWQGNTGRYCCWFWKLGGHRQPHTSARCARACSLGRHSGRPPRLFCRPSATLTQTHSSCLLPLPEVPLPLHPADGPGTTACCRCRCSLNILARSRVRSRPALPTPQRPADEPWHDNLLPLSPSLDNILSGAGGSGGFDTRPSMLPSRLLRWALRCSGRRHSAGIAAGCALGRCVVAIEVQQLETALLSSPVAFAVSSTPAPPQSLPPLLSPNPAAQSLPPPPVRSTTAGRLSTANSFDLSWLLGDAPPGGALGEPGAASAVEGECAAGCLAEGGSSCCEVPG